MERRERVTEMVGKDERERERESYEIGGKLKSGIAGVINIRL